MSFVRRRYRRILIHSGKPVQDHFFGCLQSKMMSGVSETETCQSEINLFQILLVSNLEVKTRGASVLKDTGTLLGWIFADADTSAALTNEHNPENISARKKYSTK